jgi:hypothetical protein
MQSKATTVAKYLAELPEDRRAAITTLRKTILANLDPGFEEGMQYGMIGYYVPHSRFPAGYHCDPSQPLPFAALASQKQHMALYLMGLYCGPNGAAVGDWFKDAWTRAGKKLDMGRACVRFKKLDELPLDVIAGVFRRLTAKGYIADYVASREAEGKPVKAAPGAPKKKPTTKKVAKKAAGRAAKKTTR